DFAVVRRGVRGSDERRRAQARCDGGPGAEGAVVKGGCDCSRAGLDGASGRGTGAGRAPRAGPGQPGIGGGLSGDSAVNLEKAVGTTKYTKNTKGQGAEMTGLLTAVVKRLPS